MRSHDAQKIAALALTVLLLLAGGVAILHFRMPQTDFSLLNDSNVGPIPHSPWAGNSPGRLAAQQLAIARNAAQEVPLGALTGATPIPGTAATSIIVQSPPPPPPAPRIKAAAPSQFTAPAHDLVTALLPSLKSKPSPSSAADQVSLAAIPDAATFNNTQIAPAFPRPPAVVAAGSARGASKASVPPSQGSSGSPSPAPALPNLDTADLSSVAATMPPPLELQRQREETAASTDRQTPITIETGFECSTPCTFKNLSPTHLAATLASSGFHDWFMFRVRGAAGKLVRVDIIGGTEGESRWSTLNPVYTSVLHLDDPASYRSDLATHESNSPTAWNDTGLPPTDRQQWHFIQNSWMSQPTVFSFVQRFNADAVFVAMKLPYPFGYNEAFFHQLESDPRARVIEIGRSQQDRPLLMVQIGHPDQKLVNGNPCILVYAGEHADEQDAMWVAHGMIEYLLSPGPAARKLRNDFTFLIIPMLDPDASVMGLHSRITVGFTTKSETVETRAYANWFQAWVQSNNRLDLVLDLHNLQSNEGAPVTCALMEGEGVRGEASTELHNLIIKSLNAASIAAATHPWMTGWSPDRLGGWLSYRYGPITLTYEVNSQAPGSHLNLEGMSSLGKIFAIAATELFSSTQGSALLKDIDHRRQTRLARWRKTSAILDNTDAINSEIQAEASSVPQPGGDELLVEKWTP